MIISQFISPLVMIWIFSGGAIKQLKGVNQEQITSYYIFTSILYIFLNSTIDDYVRNSIQEGQLAFYLLKPLNFFWVAFVKDSSTRLTKLIMGLPIFGILFLLNRNSIEYSALPSPVIIFPMLLISFSLVFIISFSLGLLTFWLEEVWGVQNLKYVSFLLLGGVALPYQFFPLSLQRVLYWTPFPYLINWPLRQGFTGNLSFEFIIAIGWLILLLFFGRGLWRAGIKKYSTLGVA